MERRSQGNLQWMSERQHQPSHLCLRLLGPPPFCREHVVSLKTTMIELYALLQDPRPSPTLLGRPYAIPPARKTTSKPPQIKIRGLQPCNQHYPSADTFSTAIFTPPQLRRLSSAHSGTPSAQLQTRRIAPDWSKLASADLHPWASTTLQLDRMVTAWDGSFAGPAWIRSAWIDRALTRGFLLLLAHEGLRIWSSKKPKVRWRDVHSAHVVRMPVSIFYWGWWNSGSRVREVPAYAFDSGFLVSPAFWACRVESSTPPSGFTVVSKHNTVLYLPPWPILHVYSPPHLHVCISRPVSCLHAHHLLPLRIHLGQMHPLRPRLLSCLPTAAAAAATLPLRRS